MSATIKYLADGEQVLVDGKSATLLIVWTDGTCDVRMADGQTLVDISTARIRPCETKTRMKTACDCGDYCAWCAPEVCR